jgi:very-short-patch-repair endonuclease
MNKQTYQKQKKNQHAAGKKQIQDVFTVICKTDLHVECVKEYRFHPVRKWRFDFAIPKYKIAIEIDGGVWMYGRHNRSSGYIADMEKFNAAASLGWVVLKFTPDEQYKTATFDLIKETIKNRRNEKDLEPDSEV